MVYVAVEPELTVVLAGSTARLKSEPVPDKATDCGLPAALSLTIRDPVRLPLAVGKNAILIVQREPASRLLGHVLVWEKSPMTCMLLIPKLMLP